MYDIYCYQCLNKINVIFFKKLEQMRILKIVKRLIICS